MPPKHQQTGLRTRINSVDPEILIRRDLEAKSEGLEGLGRPLFVVSGSNRTLDLSNYQSIN